MDVLWPHYGIGIHQAAALLLVPDIIFHGKVTMHWKKILQNFLLPIQHGIHFAGNINGHVKLNCHGNKNYKGISLGIKLNCHGNKN